MIEIKPSKIRRRVAAPRPAAARPSRIRREPPPIPGREKKVNPYPSEREVWFVVIGVILFAIAITALAFDIGYFI